MHENNNISKSNTHNSVRQEVTTHAADEGIEVGRVTLETRLLARDIERKDWAAAISATRTRMRAIMSEICVVAHVCFSRSESQLGSC